MFAPRILYLHSQLAPDSSIERFAELLDPKTVGLTDKSQFYAPIRFTLQICGGINAAAGAIRLDVPVHANPNWLQVMKSRFSGMCGVAAAKSMDFKTITGKSISEFAPDELSQVGKLNVFVDNKLLRLPQMPTVPVEYSVNKSEHIQKWFNEKVAPVLPELVASELSKCNSEHEINKAIEPNGVVQKTIEKTIRASLEGKSWTEFVRTHHMNSPSYMPKEFSADTLKTISSEMLQNVRQFVGAASDDIEGYLAHVRSKKLSKDPEYAPVLGKVNNNTPKINGQKMFNKLMQDAMSTPTLLHSVMDTLYTQPIGRGCRWDEDNDNAVVGRTKNPKSSGGNGGGGGGFFGKGDSGGGRGGGGGGGGGKPTVDGTKLSYSIVSTKPFPAEKNTRNDINLLWQNSLNPLQKQKVALLVEMIRSRGSSLYEKSAPKRLVDKATLLGNELIALLEGKVPKKQGQVINSAFASGMPSKDFNIDFVRALGLFFKFRLPAGVGLGKNVPIEQNAWFQVCAHIVLTGNDKNYILQMQESVPEFAEASRYVLTNVDQDSVVAWLASGAFNVLAGGASLLAKGGGYVFESVFGGSDKAQSNYVPQIIKYDNQLTDEQQLELDRNVILDATDPNKQKEINALKVTQGELLRTLANADVIRQFQKLGSDYLRLKDQRVNYIELIDAFVDKNAMERPILLNLICLENNLDVRKASTNRSMKSDNYYLIALHNNLVYKGGFANLNAVVPPKGKEKEDSPLEESDSQDSEYVPPEEDASGTDQSGTDDDEQSQEEEKEPAPVPKMEQNGEPDVLAGEGLLSTPIDAQSMIAAILATTSKVAAMGLLNQYQKAPIIEFAKKLGVNVNFKGKQRNKNLIVTDIVNVVKDNKKNIDLSAIKSHHPWNALIHHSLFPVNGAYPTYYNVLHTKQDMSKDAPYVGGDLNETYKYYHMFMGGAMMPPGKVINQKSPPAPIESKMRERLVPIAARPPLVHISKIRPAVTRVAPVRARLVDTTPKRVESEETETAEKKLHYTQLPSVNDVFDD